MPQPELKLFGTFRSGSNLVRTLLQSNFDVIVHNNTYAYKHLTIPANYQVSAYQPFPLNIVGTVKDPFAFLDSAFRYCQKNNYLNIDGGQTFDQFIRQKFVIFDGGFKDFPRYRFANPVQYWNALNSNLLSIPDDRIFIVRYESLLKDMEARIIDLAQHFGLKRTSKEFLQPANVTKNLGDQSFESLSDYMTETVFEREKYYLDREYMQLFTDAQQDFIFSELDIDVLQALSYMPSSSITQSESAKSSFVENIQNLVKLGNKQADLLKANFQEAQRKKTSLIKTLEEEIEELQHAVIASQDSKEKYEQLITEQRQQLDALTQSIDSINLELKNEKKLYKRELEVNHQRIEVLEQKLEHVSDLRTSELRIAQEKLDELTLSLENLRRDHDFQAQKGNQLEADMESLELSHENLENDYTFSLERRDQLEAQLDKSLLSNSHLESSIKELRRRELARNSVIAELNKKLGKLDQERQRLDAAYSKASKNYDELKRSYSFQFGYDFVQAFTKPGKNTILFPFRAISKFFSIRRENKQTRNVELLTAPGAVTESTRGTKKAAGPDASSPSNAAQPIRQVNKPAAGNSPTTTKIRQLEKLQSELTLACIFDEFTTQSYNRECNLVPVPLANWMDKFAQTKPDLLMVESAWKGSGGEWQYKVGKYANQDHSELKKLVGWCRKHGVPSVFWNKEDPIHFEKFIDAAKLFDVVFTTDANLIPKYREAVGHERVYSLQFSAQPHLHNPIHQYDKENKICFAGSYYANRHEDRRKDMDEILDIAQEFGLVIYDRNHERNLQGESHFCFPERFRENILGSLPYSEIDKAYKGYDFMLNVNSVKASPTMFSRRVFEGLACGTPVLSTYSLGVKKTFRDIVLIAEKGDDLRSLVSALKDDRLLYEKTAIKGVREVFSKHLYRHRLETILTKAGIRTKSENAQTVSLICVARTEKDIKQAITIQKSQTWQGTQLIVLLGEGTDTNKMVNQYNDESCSIVHLPSVLSLGADVDDLVDSEFISYLNLANHYASNYLLDLVQASIYASADVFGKNCFFEYVDEGIHLMDGDENKYHNQLWLDSSVIRSSLLKDRSLGEFVDMLASPLCIAELIDHGVRGYSVNRFNFIKAGNQADPALLSKQISNTTI